MTSSTPQMTARERTACLFFMASIVFVGLSLILNVALEASGPMMAISIVSCLFAFLPFLSISLIRREKSSTNFGLYRARTYGVLFGVLLIFFIILGVLASDEIYGPDIPAGIVILIAGFLALAGSFVYPVIINRTLHPSSLPQSNSNASLTTQMQGTVYQTNEKEIIHEKEIIVKIRCQYCGNTFNEVLDQCPVCGAKK
jgi:hypothetical protein